jgi:transposase
MSCATVAKVLLRDGDTVRTWRRLYQEDGIEGLASFGREGSDGYLNQAQQAQAKPRVTKNLARSANQLGAA